MHWKYCNEFFRFPFEAKRKSTFYYKKKIQCKLLNENDNSSAILFINKWRPHWQSVWNKVSTTTDCRRRTVVCVCLRASVHACLFLYLCVNCMYIIYKLDTCILIVLRSLFEWMCASLSCFRRFSVLCKQIADFNLKYRKDV